MMTIELMEMALPPNLKGKANQEFVDLVNNVATDPHQAEAIRDNFISYTSILQEGRYKIKDYLNAVAYVTYKHMGYSNQESWCRTFPERYQELVAANTQTREISAYVSMYNKTKLVNAILEKSLIPVWIINQDVYQEAINTQYDLMRNSKSDMVRTTAANSVLTHLAKPKEAAAAVQINIGESTGMKELKNLMTKLAQEQQGAILNGVSTQDIAAQKLIEGTAEDITDVE